MVLVLNLISRKSNLYRQFLYIYPQKSEATNKRNYVTTWGHNVKFASIHKSIEFSISHIFVKKIKYTLICCLFFKYGMRGQNFRKTASWGRRKFYSALLWGKYSWILAYFPSFPTDSVTPSDKNWFPWAEVWWAQLWSFGRSPASFRGRRFRLQLTTGRGI